MPTATPAVIQPKYLTVPEAAAILGLKPRRILDFVHTKALKSVKQRDPASGQMATRLEAGDVEAFKRERDQPRPSTSSAVSVQRPAKPLQIAAPQALAPPAPLRLWLTLEEAATYSGIPVDVLHELIRRRQLAALDTHHRANKYLIRRKTLEEFNGIHDPNAKHFNADGQYMGIEEDDEIVSGFRSR
jgi:excisionase family DNA binding protein